MLPFSSSKVRWAFWVSVWIFRLPVLWARSVASCQLILGAAKVPVAFRLPLSVGARAVLRASLLVSWAMVAVRLRVCSLVRMSPAIFRLPFCSRLAWMWSMAMVPLSSIVKMPLMSLTGMPLLSAVLGSSLRRLSAPRSVVLVSSKSGVMPSVKYSEASGRLGIKALGLMPCPMMFTLPMRSSMRLANGRSWVLACKPMPLPARAVLMLMLFRLPDRLSTLLTAMPSSSPSDTKSPDRAKGAAVLAASSPWVLDQ